MATILEWKCSDCGKVITSLYEEQLSHNKEAHILTHKLNKSTQHESIQNKPNQGQTNPNKSDPNFPQTVEEIEKKRKILKGL